MNSVLCVAPTALPSINLCHICLPLTMPAAVNLEINMIALVNSICMHVSTEIPYDSVSQTFMVI